MYLRMETESGMKSSVYISNIETKSTCSFNCRLKKRLCLNLFRYKRLSNLFSLVMHF